MSSERAAQGWDAPRAILESVTDAVFLLDRDFRFAYLNTTAQRLLQRDDLLGKHIWTEFPAALGTKFQDAYERAMRDSVRADFVEHYPAPLDRWYEVRAYPSPEGVGVYFHDITDRRLADEALARSRAQLELVMRGANVGVWYCPLPFDELVWDEKVKEHFHLPPDARVTIETFYERLHPEDREPTRAAIARSVETRESYDVEYRTCAPRGGRTNWIRAIGRAFYENEKPVRFDGITVDVTRQKQIEMALRESDERYRLATKATNDLVWDWDLGRDTILWNESLATHYGYETPDGVTPASFWVEQVHAEDRTRVVTSIRRVIDDPRAEHWQEEYRFRRSDGAWVDVLDRGFVLRDATGRGVRMIGALLDLTDRKRIERERERIIEAERAARSEAERQSHMKDDFLATLSHELRTPLNAILGWSQIMRNGPEGDEMVRGLEVIERNARAQAHIVDDLLDMSRMLSGKVRLDVQRVALGSLVDAALESARPMADARGVALAPPALDRQATVLGDPGRLQQVLWNLLSNAVKFTPRGGSVQTRVRQVDGEVEIRVRDDGEGIAPDFLPFVFERFRQADGSMSRRHGGLGLGLAIVKQVVELHGGSVRAESAGAGLGSTFTLRIPRAPNAEGTWSSDKTAPSIRRVVDLAGLRALVVEDEPDARALVCHLLEQRGAETSSAGSAAQALDLLSSSRFDVLVSDIGMPVCDGYMLLQRIRALPPERNGAIPAVAVTAYARPEDRVRAVTAGFTLHVAKPVDAVELVTMVAAAAGRVGS